MTSRSQTARSRERHESGNAGVVYSGARTLRLEPVMPVPPGPGHVRIAVAYTGICGTDLHIYHGDMDGRVQPPGVIGHEMSGRIADIGGGVDGWQAGEHEDFEAAVALIAGGQIPVSSLITRTEPLARAEQAFLALESGAGVMKVLIDCQAEQGAGVAR